MAYDDDVIAEWDAAARSHRRQAHIHPAGLHGSTAYDESGTVAALHVAGMLSDAGVFVPGVRLLDYGCGDGRVALPLARMGAQVVGCDASPAMLAELAARTVDVEPLPAGDLPGSGPYDGAYVLAVLIHQRWAAAERIVCDIAAELRPGGVLIADLPCYAREEEGGSAFGVTTFSPDRVARIAAAAGLVLQPGVTNPGRYAGRPGAHHGAWRVMVRPG